MVSNWARNDLIYFSYLLYLFLPMGWIWKKEEGSMTFIVSLSSSFFLLCVLFMHVILQRVHYKVYEFIPRVWCFFFTVTISPDFEYWCFQLFDAVCFCHKVWEWLEDSCNFLLASDYLECSVEVDDVGLCWESLEVVICVCCLFALHALTRA